MAEAADYQFITVTRVQALATETKEGTKIVFGTDWSTHPYLRIGRHFRERGIPAEKKDYINGLRVYRVYKSLLHKLDLDRLGRRILVTGEEVYVFSDVDPGLSLKPVHPLWLPIG